MLELRHVKKSYDNVTILEDINLEIQDGEIVSILGPSGCGKTTLLNLVLGLTPADSGEILFNGKESVAVVDKGGDTNPLAQEMAECIITQGRSELQKYYPNAVYEGETTDEANSSAYPKVFPEPLTLSLLEKHQELSESCK